MNNQCMKLATTQGLSCFFKILFDYVVQYIWRYVSKHCFTISILSICIPQKEKLSVLFHNISLAFCLTRCSMRRDITWKHIIKCVPARVNQAVVALLWRHNFLSFYNIGLKISIQHVQCLYYPTTKFGVRWVTDSRELKHKCNENVEVGYSYKA